MKIAREFDMKTPGIVPEGTHEAKETEQLGVRRVA